MFQVQTYFIDNLMLRDSDRMVASLRSYANPTSILCSRCRRSAVPAAKGMPLYAGPKRTSNSGSPGEVFSAEAIVAAYAEQRVSSTGPDARRPALKKYGDKLRSRANEERRSGDRRA